MGEETEEDPVPKKKTSAIIAKKPVTGPMNAKKVHAVEAITTEADDNLTEEDVLAQVPAEVAPDTVKGIEAGIGTDTREEGKGLLRIPDQDLNSHLLQFNLIFLDPEAKAKNGKEEDPGTSQGKDQERAEVNSEGKRCKAFP